MASSSAPHAPSSPLSNWGEIIRTQNLSSDRTMDPVSRWLLIIRASVFPMTILSALVGGLLAAGAPDAHFGYFALALVGLVAAHAANNMINDYFDLEGGVDSEGYVRTQYAPHPVLSGLISKKGLIAAIAAVNLLDLAILGVLADARGWQVVAFALAGLFISVFYVAPPFKLAGAGLRVLPRRRPLLREQPARRDEPGGLGVRRLARGRARGAAAEPVHRRVPRAARGGDRESL
jgi:1,4-dihydroxy-2-naphthoate octaprenyltransferase